MVAKEASAFRLKNMQVITVLTCYLLVFQTVPVIGWTAPACGSSLVSSSKRYVQSERKAKEGEFPWVVTVDGSRGSQHFECAGSLITPEFVLTSARCIFGMYPNDSLVQAGDLRIDGNSKYIQFVYAESFIVHEKYFQPWQHDIGLVKLSEPFDLIKGDGRIGTVCAPVAPYASFSEVTVIGWGRKEDAAYDGELRAAVVPVRDSQDCEKWSPNFNNNTFCAGGFGTGSCGNDWGSPAVVKSSQGWVLVGVTSYIFKCDFQPAYYTSVMQYVDWIKEKIKEHKSRGRRG